MFSLKLISRTFDSVICWIVPNVTLQAILLQVTAIELEHLELIMLKSAVYTPFLAVDFPYHNNSRKLQPMKLSRFYRMRECDAKSEAVLRAKTVVRQLTEGMHPCT